MGFVRSKAFGIGVTVIILGGLIYLARKTNAGDFVLQGLQGFGKSTGEGIVAPFTGLVQGVNLGGQALAQQLGAGQEALFNQFKITTDQFNKFIHPDWYNADGSFSPNNPNFGNFPSSIGPQTIDQPVNTQQTTVNSNSSQKISGLNFSLPNIPQFAIFNNTNSQTTSDNTSNQTTTNTAVDNFFGSGKIYNGPPVKLG